MTKTSDGDSFPIVMFDLTNGAPMSQAGEKDQTLGTSKLWNLDRLDQRVLPLNSTYRSVLPLRMDSGSALPNLAALTLSCSPYI